MTIRCKPGAPLSPRELEVLKLIASGLTALEIGDRLGINVRTARTHSERLQTKLGAHNAPHAVDLGHRSGLLGGDRR